MAGVTRERLKCFFSRKTKVLFGSAKILAWYSNSWKLLAQAAGKLLYVPKCTPHQIADLHYNLQQQIKVTQHY
jgi:uncharacterized RmlC-like cupin family protein